ncbi:MAG: hypothetical protein ABEJ93_04490 [Candidatus Nanohalobium sp.]
MDKHVCLIPSGEYWGGLNGVSEERLGDRGYDVDEFEETGAGEEIEGARRLYEKIREDYSHADELNLIGHCSAGFSALYLLEEYSEDVFEGIDNVNIIALDTPTGISRGEEEYKLDLEDFPEKVDIYAVYPEVTAGENRLEDVNTVEVGVLEDLNKKMIEEDYSRDGGNSDLLKSIMEGAHRFEGPEETVGEVINAILEGNTRQLEEIDDVTDYSSAKSSGRKVVARS